MRYLVTGGAGFIGHNLVERLRKDGHGVIICDNLSTGHEPFLDWHHKDIYGIPSAHNSYSILRNPDGIFHLGIPSSTSIYEENPVETTSGVVKDFTWLMEYCKELRVRLVYASTSNLYNGNPIPWKEQMSIWPNTYYTVARKLVEELASFYYNAYDIKTVGLRFCSVYGPGEEHKPSNFRNVITQMMTSRLNKGTFVIYGDGSQTRDSVHVDDVVEALVLAMEKKEVQGVFNVGTGSNKTFSEMSKLIKVDTVYTGKFSKGYVKEQLVDIKWTEEILGFKAKVSLEEGLERQWQYLQSFYQQKMK
jgi:UDP-glucose 4-epimerase